MGFTPIYRAGSGISLAGNQISALGQGAGQIPTYLAGTDLNANVIVTLSNGKVYPSQLNDDPDAILGMTTESVLSNSQVPVIRSGRITGLTLTADVDYFLGEDGSITTIVPVSGLLLPVGRSVSTTDLALSIGTGVVR